MARSQKVDQDSYLAGAVALVWAALAGLYEWVPALRMPGSSLLWGSGALVFAIIAVAIAWSRSSVAGGGSVAAGARAGDNVSGTGPE